jgi:general secretion pathway protein N
VADVLRPASMVVGAVCLWAVSVLMLALAGLGARVEGSGAPADPPALPQVSLTAAPSRLTALVDYAQVGQRPLMSPDRRPAPVAAAGGSDELDVMLTSVLLTPRLQLAILTGNTDQRSYRVRVGDTVEGSNWRLAQLDARRAVLEGPGGQRTLELRVFDGQGGQPPTPLAGGTDAAANADGDRPRPIGANGQIPGGVAPANAARPPTTAATAPARPSPTDAPQTTAVPQPPSSQDAQIEAIRRRIEARRAQMRAEAEAAGNQNR